MWGSTLVSQAGFLGRHSPLPPGQEEAAVWQKQGWRCASRQHHPGEVSRRMVRLQHVGRTLPDPLPHIWLDVTEDTGAQSRQWRQPEAGRRSKPSPPLAEGSRALGPFCAQPQATPRATTQVGAARVDKAQALCFMSMRKPCGRGDGSQQERVAGILPWHGPKRPATGKQREPRLCPLLCEDTQGSRGGQGLAGLHRRTTPGLTRLSPVAGGSLRPYPSPNAPSLLTE